MYISPLVVKVAEPDGTLNAQQISDAVPKFGLKVGVVQFHVYPEVVRVMVGVFCKVIVTTTVSPEVGTKLALVILPAPAAVQPPLVPPPAQLPWPMGVIALHDPEPGVEVAVAVAVAPSMAR